VAALEAGNGVSSPMMFPSLAAARRIIEAWRTDYNTVRPHSSLGGMAPAEFTNRPRQGHMETEANLSAA
jgi:putative transposase